MTSPLRGVWDLPYPSPVLRGRGWWFVHTTPFFCVWACSGPRWTDIPMPRPPGAPASMHSLCLQESAQWQKTSRPKLRTTRLPLLTAASPTRTRPGTAGRTTWVSRALLGGCKGEIQTSPDSRPQIAHLLPPPRELIHPKPLLFYSGHPALQGLYPSSSAVFKIWTWVMNFGSYNDFF